MIWLFLLLVLVTGALATVCYLLGFQLGGSTTSQELLRIQQEGREAGRQIHDLTRAAFVAMADEAARRRLR